MSKRDSIQEMLKKKERLSPNSPRLQQVWERISRLEKVGRLLDQLVPASDLMYEIEAATEDSDYHYGKLDEIHNMYDEIRYEAIHYLPIGLVACMEGYFRLAYADLINSRPSFRKNAARFDTKFSIQTAISLQEHALSLGEFVAHQLATNNLGDINSNLCTIIGEDFLEIFKNVRPRLDPQIYMFETAGEEITSWVIGTVGRQFELRHLYCHEADPPIRQDDIDVLRGGVEAVREFLWVSDFIINEKLG